MKKIPLDPEHRAGQKKIRKMLAAGLPLAALLSSLAAGCGDLKPQPVGIMPREPDDSEEIVPRGKMLMDEEPRKPKTDKPVPLAGVPPPPPVAGKPLLPAVHVVKKGDTLVSIARQYGTTAAKLKKLNGFSDKEPVQLKAGQKIKLK